MVAFISIAAVAAASVFFRPTPAHRLDAGWGDYPEFLAAVRDATHDGDTIALIVPARPGSNDSEYAYYRASYLLAGRELRPAADGGNALYVAAWHAHIASDRRIIFRAHGGTLAAR